MSIEKKVAEPYQVLFPIGIGLAFIGVLPWILFSAGIISIYPNVIHSRIMVSGFLMAFVSGFLMTAVPKMSGSKSSSIFEVSFCGLLIFMQVFLSLFNFLTASAVVGCLQFIFLIVHLGLRIKSRTQDPPNIFVFIPVGILSGLVGYLILLYADQASYEWLTYGKNLLYQSFILNLILGLGSRLVPVLSRVPGAISPLEQGRNKLAHSVLVLILINSSFLIEVFLSKPLGLALRFLVVGYVTVFRFKIFREPTEFTVLGFCLRIASVFLAIPYLLIFVLPAYELHFLHLFFISGFSLLTLMVAVRVVLSHGGHSLNLEKESKALLAVAGIMTAATFVRALGPIFFPGQFFIWISVASILWVTSILLWTKLFWPKVFNSARGGS